MTTATSPILERVKKLLALSQSDNVNERDMAIAKANALIAEHQIDLVLLESTDTSKPEVFDEQVVEMGRRMPVESKFIAWLLKAHFRCDVLFGSKWMGSGRVRTFDIIGRKSDAEFGRWLVGYLREEFNRRWDYYRKSHDVPAGERNTFLYGLYSGLNQKLAEEREAAETRRITEIASVTAPTTLDGIAGQAPTADQLKGKYALAVQDEKEQRRAEVARRYPRLRTSSTRLNLRTGSMAMHHGVAAGRTISTSRPLAA
jgi:hypothetical protein